MGRIGRMLASVLPALSVLWLMTSPLATHASAASASALEDDIKAVYIYNFIRFAEWPEKRAGKQLRATLAIMGNLQLLKVFKSQNFQNASGHLRLESSACDTPLCATQSQVLFIDRSEKMELARILHALNGKAILTISDIDGFAESGGMIELRREKDRVMFRINLEAVRKSGLYISAQLLQLGEIVGEQP